MLNDIDFIKTCDVPGPSKEAIRAIALYKSEVTGKDIVVDVGCGTGGFTCEFGQRAGKVIGIDTNPEAIRITRENLRKFNIDGDITQGKLEDNGESGKEHTLDKKEPKKNYVVYIGESLITVYKIVSKENILKKYIDNNTIKIIDDKDNDLEEAKIVNGIFKGSVGRGIVR